MAEKHTYCVCEIGTGAMATQGNNTNGRHPKTFIISVLNILETT